MTPCYRGTPTGIEVRLRVTPNAKINRIETIEQRDDGTAVLRVRVNAVPDKGKANKAVITLIAKTLGIAKTAITIKSGETARLKTIAIIGNTAGLMENMAQFHHIQP